LLVFDVVLDRGVDDHVVTEEQAVNGQAINRPKRATWRLRRCGRVRMPYAAALLDLYTSVMSRKAFDLDFMSPGLDTLGDNPKAAQSAVVPVPEVSIAAEPAPTAVEA
jgi:hypothetical protein